MHVFRTNAALAAGWARWSRDFDAEGHVEGADGAAPGAQRTSHSARPRARHTTATAAARRASPVPLQLGLVRHLLGRLGYGCPEFEAMASDSLDSRELLLAVRWLANLVPGLT